MSQSRSADDEPTLFDLPPEPSPAPAPKPGRARETYVRTVTARVTVVDEAALREAAGWAVEQGIVVVVYDDADAEDEDAGEEAVGALEVLVEPTAGLRPLLEDGALWLTAVELTVEELTPTESEVSWTVKAKLRDVPAVREAALRACPPGDVAARTEIESSLAAAWNRAADPYAPLHDVPGVRWEGRAVTVEHVPARAGRGSP